MSNKENRKGVYFSKSNQDLKEYVEDNIIDFTSYIMDLIRRDMNGELNQVKVINQNLREIKSSLATIQEDVEQLKQQPVPQSFHPMFYQPQMATPFQAPVAVEPQPQPLEAAEPSTSRPSRKPRSKEDKQKIAKALQMGNE